MSGQIETLIVDNTSTGGSNPRIDSTSIENAPTLTSSTSAANNYIPTSETVASREYNADGSVGDAASPSSSTVPINKDTTALKQKGDIHEDGESSNPDLKNSTQAFKNAVGTSAGILSAAALIKSTLQNSRARDPVDNYYLTNAEKALLARRAGEFSAPGIVPYDVIEQFLYILVTISEYQDLSYIAGVTGVYELNDRNLVRNPTAILNIRELYKVGYLANGLASINKQFSTSYHNASYAADSQNSILGPLLGVASFASSPLGALSNVYGVQQAVSSIGLTGTAATAAALALTAASSITQFPGVDVTSGVVESIESQIATIMTTTDQFGTPSGLGGTAGQLAQCSSVVSSLTSLAAQAQEASSIVAKHGVNDMGPTAAQLMTLSKKIKAVVGQNNQLAAVTTVPSTALKQQDLKNQLTQINAMVVELASDAASIASTLGGVSGPGNIGPAASMLQRIGGYAPAASITQIVLGQRVRPSVACRNPMMQPPSYAGRAFFGESSGVQIATDQMFCRRIASYPSNQAGSGLMGFMMQNYGSYGGGDISILGLTSLVTLGVLTPPSGGSLGASIATLATSVASIMGGSSSSIVDPRRSDNAIPYMIAASSAMVGDTKCPFSTGVFTSGWQVASSVANDLQKHSPTTRAFLETARTSL
jgi:hypothetical protein